MDAIADELDIQVGQNDLTERLVLMSRQYGIEPQQLLQVLQQNNQLPAMFADVRRGLTIAAVVHGATVTDTEGNEVDTDRVLRPATPRGRPTPQRADRRRRSTRPTTDDAGDADDERRRRGPTTRSDAVSERARVGECPARCVG